MVEQVAAYQGSDPYFFVSYSHEDTDLVVEELRWLNEAGFNIWYDEGIHVGTVWRQALADALSNTSGLIFFATRQSHESSNCLKELNFVLDEEIPVFVVRLDDAPLPTLLKLSLSDRQTLNKNEYDEATYRRRLISALSSVVAPSSKVTPAVDKAIETKIPSIGLQPISSQSGDEDLAFWVDGVTEDLQTYLLQRTFRVVSTRDVNPEPRELGASLGVAYVLSGSARAGSEGRLRVNLKLVDSSNGAQIWGQRYEKAGDRFEVADALTKEAAIKISEAIMDYETLSVRAVPDDKLDAWALCLKAADIKMNSLSHRDEGIRLLRLAVERDPSLSMAHGMLATFLTMSILTMFSKDRETDVSEAVSHADRALALSPNSPIAMMQAAFVYRLFGSETRALELSQRSNAAAGSDSLFGARYIGNSLYSTLIQLGRAEEAIELALRDEPPPARMIYTACVVLGRYEEALEWVQRGLTTDPELYLLYVELANALGHLGRQDEAREQIEKVKTMVPTFRIAYFQRGTRLAWRDKDEVVGPQVDGLRDLGID